MAGDLNTRAFGPAVAAGELGGVVSLVWQRGEIIERAATGWHDKAAGRPLLPNALFRIASLTKPVTSMAAMTLWQDGRFALDEPITRWAPECATMTVLRSIDGALDDTVPARRAITFGDLLTHRAGVTYGAFHGGPLAAAYQDALGADIDSALSPDQWIAGLAGLPLVDQPGAAFHYGCSTDLLGLIIARIDDRPLGEVLTRRLFAPLGMTDTGFRVPRFKRPRRAGLHGFDAAGQLTALSVAPGGATVEERPDDMTFESGGAGLWSTVDDYLSFARLFVSGGVVDGVRILAPETLAVMTANALTDGQRLGASMLGMSVFGAGSGFGLGVAVTLEPATASVMRGRGGVGTVGWPGAYGGWWQADPTNQAVMIVLMHNMTTLDQMAEGIGLAGYDGVMRFHALASAALGA